MELAGRINVNMPYYAMRRIGRALNGRSRSLRGARILVLGAAYKQDVGDLRESPSLKLIELLRADGADVSYHDPHVPALDDEGLASVDLDAPTLETVDCVVIATAHSALDLDLVVDRAEFVVDLRDAIRRRRSRDASREVPANVDVL